MRNPNQYGTVFKMSGARRNPWRVRKMTGRTEEGKPVYTNIGYTRTRAEGMLLLANYNTNPWDMNVVNLTFAEVHEMYQKNDKKEYSKHTIASRKSAYKHLEPLHNVAIKELKTLHFQNLVDSLEGGSSVKKNIKTVALSVYNYAVKNDIVEKNYAEFIQIDRRNDPETTRKAFTYEDINMVWNERSERYDIIKILLFSGFRISELLELKTENIHLEEGYMIGGSKTKAGTNRVVPISRHIKPFIEKYYNPENTYLFASSKTDHQKYSAFAAWYRRNIKDYVIHDTRHTFITLFSQTDADKLSIKRIVGHTARDITDDVYTHKSIENFKEAMSKLDTFIDTFLDRI